MKITHCLLTLTLCIHLLIRMALDPILRKESDGYVLLNVLLSFIELALSVVLLVEATGL